MSVTFDGVVKRFGARPAVEGAGAEIGDGEFFAVLGPSGCGKSTLLRLIAGLDRLDAGRIALDGTIAADGATGLHVAPEARGVGVVFQSYALWPHLSVLRNVSFPIETAGAARRDWEAAAARHLKTVALEGFEGRKPAELSGGQRQRVALARCLAGGARIVLMDEPLANLDPHLRAAMEEELSMFHREAGATTLYITHDQREAMALADRIAVMRAGRFEQVGPPPEIYERPATEEVARFIGRGAIVDGTLTAASGGAARVEAPGGLAIDVAAPQAARPGPTRVLIRPENARLAAPETAGAAPARVVSVKYRGGVYEASCAVEGWPEPAPVASTAPLRIDEAVSLVIDGGWAIPTTATD